VTVTCSETVISSQLKQSYDVRNQQEAQLPHRERQHESSSINHTLPKTRLSVPGLQFCPDSMSLASVDFMQLAIKAAYCVKQRVIMAKVSQGCLDSIPPFRKTPNSGLLKLALRN